MLRSIFLLTNMAFALLTTVVFTASAQEMVDDTSITMPNTTNLTAKYFADEGSEKVQLTYGPFNATPSNINNGMVDYMLFNVTKPCSDCLITWMQAGLVYTNGTYANANTGLWLHHTVLFNLNRTDPVCGATIHGQPIFASGNERTTVSICANGTSQTGYYLGADEQLAMVVELMNENTDTEPVLVTITYEYLPGIPDGFSTVTPLWLDVGNCSSSEIPPPNEPVFTLAMKPWKTPFSGQISLTGGHLHDGGVSIEIIKNKKTICNSIAAYGQSIGYNESSSVMDMPGMDTESDMTHISSMSGCANPGSTKAGDEWSLKAHYNFTKYVPMKDSNGSIDPVMGIAMIYLIHNDTAVNDTSNPMDVPMTTSKNAAAAATSVSSLLVAGGIVAMLI